MEGTSGTDEWESSQKGYRGRLLSGTGQVVVGLVFVMTFVVHAATYGTINNQLGNFLFGFFIVSTGIMGAGRKPMKSEIIAYMVASGLTIGVLGYLLVTSVTNLIALMVIDETDDTSLSEAIINWVVYVSGISFSISGIVFAILSFCD